MRFSFIFAVLVGSLSLSACGSGAGAGSNNVGGACTSDRDCIDFCDTSGEFGVGMCSLGCASDHDCPDGAICIGDQGGICAVTCERGDDCEGFGRGFVCGKESHFSSGGKVDICRLP